ncbi:hypothetical protein GCM10009779_40800 [Polymorphospora rubra]|uniref:CRISPR-associated protein n=2 Tax=Polymorphospora rubra TaxID=338584 RepID=A0A810MZJ2_9ACTN|nr:hypothetical protein Prubr_17960 [Polymorphospora rubra]
MDTLDQMNDRLRRIFRGEETFGEGKAVEQARRYRLTEMLSTTVARARENSANVAVPTFDLLISLSGFSPETTIFAYELLRPRRLLIVGSDRTRDSVDTIWSALQGKLAISDLQHVQCDPVDPLDIYRIVHRAVPGSNDSGKRPRVIIDITGGKKVMSASAALAAAQLDLPLCYIDGHFDVELRQSRPGTERLVILPNPTELFGEREIRAAESAFRHGAYAAAHARFAEIAESVFEPARARFLRDLADLYQAWCDLDFAGLPDRVRVMRERLRDPGYRPGRSIVDRLARQLDFLDRLATDQSGPALLLNFYLLGEHYSKLGRHDFAALLYYRTIENSFSLRLASRYAGFSCRKPDYALLSDDQEALADKFQRLASEVHRRPVAGLPWRIGLMDAAILLVAVDDPMMPATQIKDVNGLRHLSGLSEARNQSVLAHGSVSVTPKLSEELRNRAGVNLRGYWRLDRTDADVDTLIRTLQFVVEV